MNGSELSLAKCCRNISHPLISSQQKYVCITAHTINVSERVIKVASVSLLEVTTELAGDLDVT